MITDLVLVYFPYIWHTMRQKSFPHGISHRHSWHCVRSRKDYTNKYDIRKQGQEKHQVFFILICWFSDFKPFSEKPKPTPINSFSDKLKALIRNWYLLIIFSILLYSTSISNTVINIRRTKYNFHCFLLHTVLHGADLLLNKSL